MPTAAQLLGAQLLEKQSALQAFFRDHESKVADQPYVMTPEEVEKVKAWNAEVDDLGKKWQGVKELEDIAAKNHELGRELARPRRSLPLGIGPVAEPEQKSIGEHTIDLYYRDGKFQKSMKGGEYEIAECGLDEFKTTMATTAGYAPPIIRSGRLMLTPQRPLMVADVLPAINLSTGNAYTYMNETVFTNNAATIAEGGAYPESALQYAEATMPVRKVGTYIPVTDEQLADVDGMRQLVDGRLRYMAEYVLDSQILNGDGNSPNLNGIYTQVTQAQAKGADPVFDTVLKGAVLCQTVGMANPDTVIMHPLDFQDVRLTRTTDGIYIMGNPDQVGLDRLFGMRVVVSQAAPQNTGIVGDFAGFSSLIQRAGAEVQIGLINDNFIKGIQCLRVQLRAAVVVFRISAFCKLTGI